MWFVILDQDHQEGTRSGAGGENVFSFGDFARVLWRRLWVVLLVTLAFAAAAVAISLSQTPQYEASIKILVGQESGITESPNDARGLQELTQTMAEAVTSRPVAETVIERLGLDVGLGDFLENNLTAGQIPDTQFVGVSYRDPDPERAQLIANTVGDVFSEEISEVSPSANAITATVWERAVAPEEPVTPNPLRDGLLALVIGFIVGVGLAFLLEYLDPTWRSPEEVEQVSGVPTFGMIPQFAASELSSSRGKKGRG